MVKLDGFIKNEHYFLKNHKYENMHESEALGHTNVLCSKVCIFAAIKNASINDSRPNSRFDAFSTVHTKTFENDRIARCDVS